MSFSGVKKERPIFPHIHLVSNITFGDDNILSPAIKITIYIANIYLVVCLSILCMVIFHYPNKAIVTLRGSNKPAAVSFWGLM